MFACESLLNRNKIDPFLERMVTGDEKWVSYDNVKGKRARSKSGEDAQKVAKEGIIHYELLPYAPKRSIWTCTAINWTA